MFTFKGKITRKDASGFHGVLIPDLGVFTQGKNLKDCLKMAKEAVDLTYDVQSQVLSSGQTTFFVSANDSKKLIAGFLQTMRSNAGLSISEVAHRMGAKSKNSYAQYEQGKALPSLDKLDQLIRAMNPDQFVVISKEEKKAS